MNTIIPIIIPQRHEVNCIIQAGIRYCEDKASNPKVFGLGMIIFIIWFIGLILLLNKAFDEHGSEYGFWWLLPLGYLLLPFILLVLFG